MKIFEIVTANNLKYLVESESVEQAIVLVKPEIEKEAAEIEKLSKEFTKLSTSGLKTYAPDYSIISVTLLSGKFINNENKEAGR